MKPRVFIGSSSESLNLANAIKHGLGSDIECTVWTDSFFKLSSSTIDDLSAGVDKFDAGMPWFHVPKPLVPPLCH